MGLFGRVALLFPPTHCARTYDPCRFSFLVLLIVACYFWLICHYLPTEYLDSSPGAYGAGRLYHTHAKVSVDFFFQSSVFTCSFVFFFLIFFARDGTDVCERERGTSADLNVERLACNTDRLFVFNPSFHPSSVLACCAWLRTRHHILFFLGRICYVSTRLVHFECCSFNPPPPPYVYVSTCLRLSSSSSFDAGVRARRTSIRGGRFRVPPVRGHQHHPGAPNAPGVL